MDTIVLIVREFWWIGVLLAAIFIYQLFKPKIKGFLGEKTISAIVSTLPKEKYILLNDIILPTENATTQIDHIIVSVYGVFVIETKNYAGKIYGNETSAEWTQYLGKQKNKFQNPIRQNYGHVKTIENLLSEFENIKIFSIIAFSAQCDLKVKAKNSYVVYFPQIKKIILKLSQEEILTAQQMEKIVLTLKEKDMNNKQTRKEHVEKINEKLADETNKIIEGICPKCGGKLILRKSKRGSFWGCENFPKCRFTKDAN